LCYHDTSNDKHLFVILAQYPPMY